MTVRPVSSLIAVNFSEGPCWKRHKLLSDSEIKSNFPLFSQQLKNASDKDCKRAVLQFAGHALAILRRDLQWQSDLLEALLNEEDMSQLWLSHHLFPLLEAIMQNQDHAWRLLNAFSRWSHVNKDKADALVGAMIRLHDAVADKLWNELVATPSEIASWEEPLRVAFLSELLATRPYLIPEALDLIAQWRVPSPYPVLLALAFSKQNVAGLLCCEMDKWRHCLDAQQLESVIAPMVRAYRVACQFLLSNAWRLGCETQELRVRVLKLILRDHPVGASKILLSYQNFDAWAPLVDPDTRLTVACEACRQYYPAAENALHYVMKEWREYFTPQQRGAIIEAAMKHYGAQLWGTFFAQLQENAQDGESILTQAQWKSIFDVLISSVYAARIDCLYAIAELLRNGPCPRAVIPYVLEKLLNAPRSDPRMDALYNKILTDLPVWHGMFSDDPAIQSELKMLFLRKASDATEAAIIFAWLFQLGLDEPIKQFFVCELQHRKQWDLPLENWYRRGLISEILYLHMTVATRACRLSAECKALLLQHAGDPAVAAPRFQALLLGHAHEFTAAELSQLGADRVQEYPLLVWEGQTLISMICMADFMQPTYFWAAVQFVQREDLREWPAVKALTEKIAEYLQDRDIFHNLISANPAIVKDADVMSWIDRMHGVKNWFFYMALACRYRHSLPLSDLTPDHFARESGWNLERLRLAERHQLPNVSQCASYGQSIEQFLNYLRDNDLLGSLQVNNGASRQLKLLYQHIDRPEETVEGLEWYPKGPQMIRDMKELLDHCMSLVQNNQREIIGVLVSYLGTIFINCETGKHEAILAMRNALHCHYGNKASTLEAFIGDLVAHAKEEFFQQFIDEKANDQFPLLNHHDTHWLGRARAILSPYLGGTFSSFDDANIHPGLRTATTLTLRRSFTVELIASNIRAYICADETRIEECKTLVEAYLRKHFEDREGWQYPLFRILYGMDPQEIDSYYDLPAAGTEGGDPAPHPSLNALFKEKADIEEILVLCGFAQRQVL